jgi:hypothetical protein
MWRAHDGQPLACLVVFMRLELMVFGSRQRGSISCQVVDDPLPLVDNPYFMFSHDVIS